MKFFSKGNMASEDVQAYTKTGKFKASGTYASIHDGAVVVAGGLENSTVYGNTSAPIKDKNIRALTAPASTADKVVIVDYAGVSNGNIMGNNYKIGFKTLGLTAPAGEPVRYRIPQIGDEFYLGSDNITGGDIGKYAVVTANTTILTAVTTLPATGFALFIEDSAKVTQGTQADESAFYCTVKQI